MRLLSDIADRMAAFAAAVTGEAWAPGDGVAAPARLRTILLSSVVALPLLPLALSTVMPVSAALPAGAAPCDQCRRWHSQPLPNSGCSE